MPNWLGKLFDSNEREIDRLRPIVKRINELEPQLQKLHDYELRGTTDSLKEQILKVWAEAHDEVRSRILGSELDGLDSQLTQIFQQDFKARNRFGFQQNIVEIRSYLAQIFDLEYERIVRSQLRPGFAKYLFPIRHEIDRFRGNARAVVDQKDIGIDPLVDTSDHRDRLLAATEDQYNQLIFEFLGEPAPEPTHLTEKVIGKDTRRIDASHLPAVAGEIRARAIEYLKAEYLGIVSAKLDSSAFKSFVRDIAERSVSDLTPKEFDVLLKKFGNVMEMALAEFLNQFRTQANARADKVTEDVLPEAFAAVREAARRTIGMRHFDVQLIGGMVLHHGKISEMKTGEGKTLVATLPLYLNSLAGRGCHLVTVNDYLARRDAYWMAPVYSALGTTVASVFPPQSAAEHLPALYYDPDPEQVNENDRRWPYFRPVTRKEAYGADITYGTNNEFGFDYLRDNMAIDASYKVQRRLNYAIVDEVDNILIDEARTPLIISISQERAVQEYETLGNVAEILKEMDAREKEREQRALMIAGYVRQLRKDEDYHIEEKERQAYIVETEDQNRGYNKLTRWLKGAGLIKSSGAFFDEENAELRELIKNAVNAEVIFKKDRDYVVKDGQVIIVDEFTGRLMFGRRYSESLHEAIEAKEAAHGAGIRVQRENVTLATITFQNYFRLYCKLAGMTGTAATEAEEFFKIYKLEVVQIPTNKPMIRQDLNDLIYKDEDSKFKAIANEIEKLSKEGRPLLIGTVSIEKSELLSGLLLRKGVQHQVLNAKYHEKEAEIVRQAGKPGGVTVATNMAGRGVDIILGGKTPEAEDFGDQKEFEKMYAEWKQEHERVIGLGGLHVIGTERHEARRIDNQLRGRAGRQGDPGSSQFFVSLEDDIVRRFGGDRVKGVMEWAGMDENTSIEHPMISRAIENSQVKVEAYHFDIRKHLVDYDNVVNKHREVIYGERDKILQGADLKANILDMVKQHIERTVENHSDGYEQIDLAGILREMADVLTLPGNIKAMRLEELGRKQLAESLYDYAKQIYDLREKEQGIEEMRLLERLVMLRVIDGRWMRHLTEMDHLRHSVGLQSVRQIDPLVIYKKEGGEFFDMLMAGIQDDIVHRIYKLNLEKREAGSRPPAPPPGQKVGRNDPCPCGSGKKYKHCHGK